MPTAAPATPHAPPDRTGVVVTVTMLVLAVLGIAAVFHGPIAAVLSPPAPGVEAAAASR